MESLFEKILDANKRIEKIISKTPLQKSIFLSGENQVYLKLEFLQHTGSFKLRGATNKLSLIKEKHVYTASSGNHGFAVSYAANKLEKTAVVYCPKTVDSTKAFGIKSLGSKLIDKFENSLDAEIQARKDSENDKIPYISPYNDFDVLCGQGTIGIEILDQMEVKPDAIFVSCGGGGLIAGIATYVKEKLPQCLIVGCSPKNSPFLHESVKANKILFDVPEYETLSDGTAGGMEENSVTFPICQKLVDKWILVSEEEIAKALKDLAEKEHYIVEGSAAVALASYYKSGFKNMNVVIVLCGRNINFKKFQKATL